MIIVNNFNQSIQGGLAIDPWLFMDSRLHKPTPDIAV